METSFKTCMFGGFDREDVIAFIQKTAEENQTRLDALMAENEQLLTDKQALSAPRRTEEFRGKALAELTQLIGRQRQWCAEQRGEYQRMAEDVLQELRRAERHVEECDLENFDRMEESLRQLEDALNSAE